MKTIFQDGSWVELNKSGIVVCGEFAHKAYHLLNEIDRKNTTYMLTDKDKMGIFALTSGAVNFNA